MPDGMQNLVGDSTLLVGEKRRRVRKQDLCLKALQGFTECM